MGGLILVVCMFSIVFVSYVVKLRELVLSNLYIGESIEMCYFNGKNYVCFELKWLNYLCCDFCCDEVYVMDKLLFD